MLHNSEHDLIRDAENETLLCSESPLATLQYETLSFSTASQLNFSTGCPSLRPGRR